VAICILLFYMELFLSS